MKVYEPGPCWVIRDDRGEPWSDEHDEHHASLADAETEISDIRAEHEDDGTPEEEAAALVDSATRIPPGHSREARYERALAWFRRDEARLAGLHAVVLPETCHQIRCDGKSEGCRKEPESDEYGHWHWATGSPFDPGGFDWIEVDGKHYCEPCSTNLLCIECSAVLGEGADLDERMCAECVADEQAKPGPDDIPLPIALTPGGIR